MINNKCVFDEGYTSTDDNIKIDELIKSIYKNKPIDFKKVDINELFNKIYINDDLELLIKLKNLKVDIKTYVTLTACLQFDTPKVLNYLIDSIVERKDIKIISSVFYELISNKRTSLKNFKHFFDKLNKEKIKHIIFPLLNSKIKF